MIVEGGGGGEEVVVSINGGLAACGAVVCPELLVGGEKIFPPAPRSAHLLGKGFRSSLIT